MSMLDRRAELLAAIGTVEDLAGRVHRGLLRLQGSGPAAPKRMPALVWEYVGDDPGDAIETQVAGRDEWRLYVYARREDQFDELLEDVRGAILATGAFKVYRVGENVTDDSQLEGELRVVSNL